MMSAIPGEGGGVGQGGRGGPGGGLGLGGMLAFDLGESDARTRLGGDVISSMFCLLVYSGVGER